MKKHVAAIKCLCSKKRAVAKENYWNQMLSWKKFLHIGFNNDLGGA